MAGPALIFSRADAARPREAGIGSVGSHRETEALAVVGNWRDGSRNSHGNGFKSETRAGFL